MTRSLAAAVVAMLSLLAQPAEHSAAAPCVHRHGFEGCSRPGAVIVGGGHSSKPPSDSDGGGGENLVDPPGTVRLVPCGPNANAQLRAVGDPQAAADAHDGCQTVDMCDAQTQTTGVPHHEYVRVVKQNDGTWSLNGSECDAVANAPPPTVTPLMVWQQAQRLIRTAQIGLAPRHDTLVNMETVMWLATAPERNLPNVAILGRPVSVHITIDHVNWNFGDGQSDRSAGPGRPYDAKRDPCATRDCPAYYGHTYTTTGEVTVTATVTWQATFRVAGGPVTAIPGTLDGPASTAALLVQEARSVLVRDPPAN